MTHHDKWLLYGFCFVGLLFSWSQGANALMWVFAIAASLTGVWIIHE